MLVTAELLSRFPLLKPLGADILAVIAGNCQSQKFTRREIVLHAGKREDHLCFLFEGRLQGVDFTIDGREVGLFFVEPGGFCGEIGLFDEEPQPEYVIALTSAVVVFLPHAVMRDIMMQSPKISGTLASKLAARIRQMTFQRTLLGLPNIGQRVCSQLWSMVAEVGRDEASEIEIRNLPTHMEIAIMLSVSRETVTRIFQSLQNRQIVKRDGPAKLIILQPSALRALAEGKEQL